MLDKRQDTIIESRPPPGAMYYWWYSPTAYIARWLVLTGIFVLFFLWITVGYYHARRRIRKGLSPMAYHRWLVPRSQRTPKPQNSYAYYRQEQGYAMPAYPEPPPVYSRADLPPTYQPPPGAPKGATQQAGASSLPPQQTGTI